MSSTTSFELTAVLVKDATTGDYSAFFAEIPGAIAQGADQKEAVNNLVDLIHLVLEDRKEDSLNEIQKNSAGEVNYITQKYKLEHA